MYFRVNFSSELRNVIKQRNKTSFKMLRKLVNVRKWERIEHKEVCHRKARMKTNTKGVICGRQMGVITVNLKKVVNWRTRFTRRDDA